MPPDRTDTRAQRLRQGSHDRRDQERKELRQRILDAASELFAVDGYAAFSLRRVAEQIGYSPGAIYRYFDDKDDLLFNVADEGFQRFRAMQRHAAASETDPEQRLRAMARAYVAFGMQYANDYHLMFMERPDLLFKSQHDRTTGWRDALSDYQEVFAAAAQTGLLRAGDTEAMSDAWWSLLHGIVALGISMNFLFDAARVNRLLDAALEMFFHGYGARP
jgi:AcrR family transcriptional regulator